MDRESREDRQGRRRTRSVTWPDRQSVAWKRTEPAPTAINAKKEKKNRGSKPYRENRCLYLLAAASAFRAFACWCSGDSDGGGGRRRQQGSRRAAALTKAVAGSHAIDSPDDDGAGGQRVPELCDERRHLVVGLAPRVRDVVEAQ